MKKILLGVAVLGLSATAAYAQSTLADLDQDGNGELSFAELFVGYPDIAQADFDAADADKSGGLNATEFASIGGSAMMDPAANPASNPAATDVPGASESLVSTSDDEDKRAPGEGEGEDDSSNGSGTDDGGTENSSN